MSERFNKIQIARFIVLIIWTNMKRLTGRQ